MESQQVTGSCIAGLKILDETASQLPVAKRQRVFPRSCLSNCASNVVAQKCWLPSSSAANDHKELKNEFYGRSHRSDEQTIVPHSFLVDASMKSPGGRNKGRSGFFVNHVEKQGLLISKHIVDLQALPPHSRIIVLRSSGSFERGKLGDFRKLGSRFDLRSSGSKEKSLRAPQKGNVSTFLGSCLKAKNEDHVRPRNVLNKRSWKASNTSGSFLPLNVREDRRSGDKRYRRPLTLENERLIAGRKQENNVTEGIGHSRQVRGVLSETTAKRHTKLRPTIGSFCKVGTISGQISRETLVSEWNEAYPCSLSFSGLKDEAYPEGLMNSEEAYQPSPVSVLEPVSDEETLPGSKCSHAVNLRGLERQLELLRAESAGSYSEAPGTIVSSDEETEAQSSLDSITKGGKDLIQFSSEEERRDFSYVTDVLREAGLYQRSPPALLHVDPAIFKSLEKKKYTKRRGTSGWRPSDRMLLFDCVSSGLVELVGSALHSLAWKQPVSTRFGRTRSIEEELWGLLVSQQKRAKKRESSGNIVLGRDDGWLELAEDVGSIIRELENELVDELIGEAVGCLNY